MHRLVLTVDVEESLSTINLLLLRLTASTLLEREFSPRDHLPSKLSSQTQKIVVDAAMSTIRSIRSSISELCGREFMLDDASLVSILIRPPWFSLIWQADTPKLASTPFQLLPLYVTHCAS